MGSPQHLQTIVDDHSLSAVSPDSPSQAVIDAIKAHVAVIDRDGNIRAVNRAWKAFARANGAADLKSTGIGANYLKVLHDAMATDRTAGNVYEGILAVLQKRRESYMIDLHREVISRQLASERGVKAQALADEARMMLIKLLCYLAAYCRRFAVGNGQRRVFKANREERSSI